VAQGSVDTYYVVDDTSSGVATSRKVINLPVPALKPGYTVECAITREDRFPSKEFPFQELLLSFTGPVRVGACFVHGDVKQLKWETSLPADVQVKDDTLYCVHANPPQLRIEANQPSPDKFVSVIAIGDGSATWEAEAAEYWSSIESQVVADDATRALATELTKDCATEHEKVAAIARHVQQAYTYRAIEFGRRGQVPNTPGQTLGLKYGDCKDHSVLLQQLMVCAGIESHLALMKTGGTLRRTLPSLDQFDHMVVYVPAESLGEASGADRLVIDATDKEADPMLCPPHGMGGRTVFVLDPDAPRFVEIPDYPSDAGTLVSKREVTLRVDDPTGGTVSADVVEEITFNAYLAPRVRALLKHYPPAERRAAIQELLSQNGQIRVTRLDVKNLERTDEPLCLAIEYVTPDVFQPLATDIDDSSLVGRLPCPWENQYMQTEYVESRQTPFEIEVPIVIRSSLTVHSPAGYELVGLNRRAGAGGTKFVAWKCACNEAGGSVTLDYEYRLTAGRHEASEYDQYCSDIKKSRMVLQAPVTLREGTVETARRAVGATAQ
jgi:hypothetical protein